MTNTGDPAESGDNAAAPDQEPQTQTERDEPELDHHLYQRFDCTGGDASQLFRAADAARRAVEQGRCIVIPTDTVYGIGADAFDPDAVQSLLSAKGRGRDMPPPVLIAEANLVRALAETVPTRAQDLIDKHWPGPLTIICRAQPSLRLDLGDAEGTIALRVPGHDLAREILRQTGPMAVSSANLTGRPAAVTCDQAVEQLGDSVAVYLDGGALADEGALPSTIVDFTQNSEGAVLRRGALSVELLRETCPDLEDLTAPADPEPQPEPEEPESEPEQGPESGPEPDASAAEPTVPVERSSLEPERAPGA